MPSIQISDEQLAAQINAHMIEALSEETRRALVEKAINAMMERPAPTTYMSKPRTKLEEAFDMAVHQHVRDLLNNDEALRAAIRDQLEVFASEMAAKFIMDTPQLRSSVLAALSSAIVDL